MMRTCFGAGPSKQSSSCLKRLTDMILDDPSLLEISHRSDEFEQMLNKTKESLRHLLDVPEQMEILFLSGGASFQFQMCAENLLKKKAGYLVTGLFSRLAYEAAQKIGNCEILYDNTHHPYDFSGFPEQIEGDYDYVYVCLNNSIYGTKTPEFYCECPVVADASSLLGIEPIDFKKYGLVFASAQKNFGISGMTIVFVRKDLDFRTNLNPLFSYVKQMEANSMLNTPPVLSIVMCGLCAEELLKRKHSLYSENIKKAKRLYEFLDRSDRYTPLVQKHRSMMNVCFRMNTETDEQVFLRRCTKAGLDGIKGHRSTGHLRVSINAFSTNEDVERLIDVMKSG